MLGTSTLNIGSSSLSFNCLCCYRIRDELEYLVSQIEYSVVNSAATMWYLLRACLADKKKIKREKNDWTDSRNRYTFTAEQTHDTRSLIRDYFGHKIVQFNFVRHSSCMQWRGGLGKDIEKPNETKKNHWIIKNVEDFVCICIDKLTQSALFNHHDHLDYPLFGYDACSTLRIASRPETPLPTSWIFHKNPFASTELTSDNESIPQASDQYLKRAERILFFIFSATGRDMKGLFVAIEGVQMRAKIFHPVKPNEWRSVCVSLAYSWHPAHCML